MKQTKGIKSVYLKNEELDATILGDKQWSWLMKVMEIKSDLVIIATSIQLLATEHRFEKWSNFPSDHLKLKKLLKSQSRPIVVISGDRHQGAIYNDENIFEITSSSLNKSISSIFDRPKEEDRYMLGEMFSGENYGLITVNTDKKIINLEIINDENIVKFDYLEELNSPHLFVLMYPVKELTLDRLNKIIEDSNSVTYIPWSL